MYCLLCVTNDDCSNTALHARRQRLLNAFNPAEAGHAASLQLQTILQAQAIPVVAPTLLLAEIAAMISRVLNDTPRAQAFARRLSRLPYLEWVPLTRAFGLIAADLAAQNRLRGADAVYAAVALRSGTTPITLDREHLTRLTGIVSTRTPTEVLPDLLPSSAS
jgi:predicted nucleic acid-binding protein